MSDWQVVPEPALRELATFLTSWPWPLTEDAALELAASHGWTVMSHEPGDSAQWLTDLVGARPWAHVTVLDGVVARGDVTTSEVLPEQTPESTAFLRDVFAGQVALLTDLLGEPTSRKPGRRPQARWLLPSGAALEVGCSLSCRWGMTSPKFVQIEADLGRR